MEKRTFALLGLFAVAAVAIVVLGFLLMGVGPAGLSEDPAPVSAMFDDTDKFTALNSPSDVEVFEQGGRSYAIVTSFWDDGIQIMDITDPSAPSPVSAVFDGNGGFAALNGPSDVEVFEQAGRSYAITVGWIDAGMQIMDITDPASPVQTWAIFDDAGGFTTMSGPVDVKVFERDGRTYAIVASDHDDGIQIMDITDPASPVQTWAIFDDAGGFAALNGPHDVEVFEQGGRAYAIVTTHDDIQIIDISDPSAPSPVSAVFDDIDGFAALNGPSDVEVFEQGARTYAIVTSFWDNGIHIADISDPSAPSPVSAVFDDTDGFAALNGPDDVEVFEQGGRVYAIVTARFGNAVQIMDISDPSAPSPISAVFDDTGGFDALFDPAGMEVFEQGGRAYAIVAASDDNAVQIMDITDPSAPSPVSAVFDGSGGFAALNGPDDVEVFEQAGRSYAIVTARFGNAVQIMDITDPSAPFPVSAVFDDTDGFAALNGPNDVEVFEQGGRAYAIVAASDDNAVQIMDITDPSAPSPVSAVFDDAGGFTTMSGPVDVEVFEQGGRAYAIVAARWDHGVQIMDITDPSAPFPVSATFGDRLHPAGDHIHREFAPSPVSATFDRYRFTILLPDDVEVFEQGARTYAIVTSWWNNGIHIVGITDPSAPSLVSAVFDDTDEFDMLGLGDVEVFEQSGRAYAIVTAHHANDVRITDITDPATLSPVSAVFDDADEVTAMSGPVDVEVFEQGGRAYAIVTAHRDNGVQIMDITDPTTLSPVSAAFDDTGGFTALNGPDDMEVFEQGGRAYAIVTAHRDNGVQIMDITDPTVPSPVSAVFGDPYGFVAMHGLEVVEVIETEGRSYAVVTGGIGTHTIDITQPTTP